MSRASIHKIIRDGAIAIQDPQFNLLDFLNSFPAQVNDTNISKINLYVLVSDRFTWSSNVMDS